MSKEVFLYLHTRGHRSGAPHTIEIWFVEHDDCCYIVSEKGEAAHWVRNIRADSAVQFRLGSGFDECAETLPAVALAPSEPELLAAVKAKMEAKYGWSNGLVVEIRPRS